MTKLIVFIVTASLLVIVGVFFFPKIFLNMGQDISDVNKYAVRMSDQILDSPKCVQFKNRFIELGKSATDMNGAFFYSMVQTKEAANKAGCGKP